jgi:uncharacterized protein (DUF2249 family)
MTTSAAAAAADIDGASATAPAEAAALETLTQHHSQLLATVVGHATALLDASAAGSLEGASSARRDLVLFCRGEVLPHSIAEEDTVYALARELPGLRVLVDAMITDHRTMAELIDDLAGATTPLGASAAAHALRVLFELHVEKDGDYILPAIAASESVSLAEGVAQLQALSDELSSAAQGGGCGCGGGGCGCGGGAAEASGPAQGGGCGCGGGGCGCGGHDDAHAGHGHGAEAGTVSAQAAASRPVLDARQVPHNIRHATVFGALDAVRPGSGLELIAPHDPLPLLAQVEERDPGAFEISYLERGPEVWRIALDRKVSVSA